MVGHPDTFGRRAPAQVSQSQVTLVPMEVERTALEMGRLPVEVKSVVACQAGPFLKVGITHGTGVGGKPFDGT